MGRRATSRAVVAFEARPGAFSHGNVTTALGIPFLPKSGGRHNATQSPLSALPRRAAMASPGPKPGVVTAHVPVPRPSTDQTWVHSCCSREKLKGALADPS
eukprot:7098800-Prymnesium_polylepis.1